MNINSTSGRPHKAGGKTFKSRRMKMTMEREAARRAVDNQKPKPEMKATLSEIFR